MVITSKENKAVCDAVKLKDKKGRAEQGRFLIEGAKLVGDALRLGVKMDRLFVVEQAADKFADCGCAVSVVSEQVLKHISDTKTNQGVIAAAYLPERKEYDGTNALLLDRIQDPRNIGAILRTACAAGYKNVFLIDCADVFSPKSIRCGMSGQFMLDFFEISQQEFLEKFGDRYIVCADMDGENIFLTECSQNHILVLGNEGQGVSDGLRKMTKKTVMIPMHNKLESLNVAVSGGIIMYELNRKMWR